VITFKLMVITDWSLPDCVDRIRDALKAGPGIAIQHRHPGATDRQFYEEGLRLKEACGPAPLFINGRLDLALALDAHLHLTDHSLFAADVRPKLGERWLSAACHPPAAAQDVDLLLVSPVFDPLSKPAERAPLGVDAFHAFARTTPTPCFALGGITAERIARLRPVAGVAVIGEVMHAASPAHAAEALLRALE
jgi:thiamine-phosphate pyrophosphorylase